MTLHLGDCDSTFLPQVWQQIGDPARFLTELSRKMGLPGDTWLDPYITVETYQAKHGWVLRDTPAYDASACAKHWQTLLALLAAKLKR